MRRALSIAALTAGLWPAAALASVTSATVTTPADPADRYFDVRNGPPFPTLPVAGAAMTSGASSNSVSLHCYSGLGGHFELPFGTFGVSAGHWSGALPLEYLMGNACRLRAIPIDNANPTDLTKFQGPALRVSALEMQRIGVEPIYSLLSATGSPSGPNAGAPFEWTLYDVRRTSRWTLGDANCPVSRGGLLDPGNFDASDHLWHCAASLPDGALHVDGHTAVLPARAAFVNPDGSGFPKLTLEPTRDDAGFSVVESEQLARCADAKCSSFADTGVTLQRTIRESADVEVDISDRYVSTDGNSHAIDAGYHVNAAVQASDAPGWRFPGQSAYATRVTGDLVPALKGPFTVLVKSRNGLPAGDSHLTHGALTFGDTPMAARFADANSIVIPVNRTAPAGGSSAPVEQTFAIGRTPASFAAITAAAEDRMAPPTVTISAPADGAHVAEPQVTLAGTATDNSGVSSLTVAGQAVTPGADGSFSRVVGLLPGANKLVVEARDAAGGAGRAEVTVTLDVPPPAGAVPGAPVTQAPKCVVPRLVGTLARKARAALSRARCALGATKKKAVKPPRKRKGKPRPRSKIGRILATNPAAGTALAAGAKVRITVAVKARKKRQRSVRRTANASSDSMAGEGS